MLIVVLSIKCHKITHANHFSFISIFFARTNIDNQDAVQAQFFPQYPGHPGSTVVAFSGGLDKIPISFGGGYGIVRDPKILKAMKEEYEKLSRQSNAGKSFMKYNEC